MATTVQTNRKIVKSSNCLKSFTAERLICIRGILIFGRLRQLCSFVATWLIVETICVLLATDCDMSQLEITSFRKLDFPRKNELQFVPNL